MSKVIVQNKTERTIRTKEGDLFGLSTLAVSEALANDLITQFRDEVVKGQEVASVEEVKQQQADLEATKAELEALKAQLAELQAKKKK